MAKVKRDLFIKERRRAINEAKRFPDLIIMDPGDLCVCDACNEEVLDELLNIEDNFLLCEKCLKENNGRYEVN
jgi:formylmethanofuran dehydrogenase subunit E